MEHSDCATVGESMCVCVGGGGQYEKSACMYFWWPFIGVDFAIGALKVWPLVALEGWPLVRGNYREETVRAFIFWPHKRGGRW